MDALDGVKAHPGTPLAGSMGRMDTYRFRVAPGPEKDRCVRVARDAVVRDSGRRDRVGAVLGRPRPLCRRGLAIVQPVHEAERVVERDVRDGLRPEARLGRVGVATRAAASSDAAEGRIGVHVGVVEAVCVGRRNRVQERDVLAVRDLELPDVVGLGHRPAVHRRVHAVRCGVRGGPGSPTYTQSAAPAGRATSRAASARRRISMRPPSAPATQRASHVPGATGVPDQGTSGAAVEVNRRRVKDGCGRASGAGFLSAGLARLINGDWRCGAGHPPLHDGAGSLAAARARCGAAYVATVVNRL
jgi:hypothetical protein